VRAFGYVYHNWAFLTKEGRLPDAKTICHTKKKTLCVQKLGMAKEIRGLLKAAKELIAIWHWFSNLVAFLTAISEHGVTEGVILWLLSSLVTAIISEIVETLIPSYLRPIFKYFFD